MIESIKKNPQNFFYIIVGIVFYILLIVGFLNGEIPITRGGPVTIEDDEGMFNLLSLMTFLFGTWSLWDGIAKWKRVYKIEKT